MISLDDSFISHEIKNTDLRDNFCSDDSSLAISAHEFPSLKTAWLQSGAVTKEELGAEDVSDCDRTAVMAKEMIKYISNILRILVILIQDRDDWQRLSVNFHPTPDHN